MVLLVEEASQRPFHGAIATLGRMDIHFSRVEVEQAAHRFAAKLIDCETRLNEDPQLAARGWISDSTFFQLLGFQEIIRIDASNYEGVDEILDLNTAETPPGLRQRFDVVLDFGTLEHVFHVPHCLAHIARMAKPGGRIVQLTPSSNCVDHGFYGVSPTLFVDYYGQAGFELQKLYLCRLPRTGIERKPWRIHDYLNRPTPCWSDLGRLDGSIYFSYVVARHPGDIRPETIPQQSAYLKKWGVAGNQPEQIQGEPAGSKAGRLLAVTARWPMLNRLARLLIVSWRTLRNRIEDRGIAAAAGPCLGRY